MNTEPQPIRKPLKTALFEQIETEKVCPHPRIFFQGRECVVWSLWFLSIVIGALAIAVSLFVVTHFQYEIYEATHENFLTFIVDVLPYIWIIVFGLMVYVAVYNLQHTKHGYRYPLWMIFASSIVLSFAGGSALQFFGFGYSIDNVLGHQMPMYTSRDKLEQKLWQVPEDGRLVGKQVFSTLSPTSTIIFEDSAGQRWRMDVSELQARDIELLASEKPMRLLGKAKDANLKIYHACGVFPLMVEREVTMADMLDERRAFVERVNKNAAKAAERQLLVEASTFASTSLPRQSICANIAAFRRVPIGN